MSEGEFEEPSTPFTENDLTNDPLELFRAWYERAIDQSPGDWYMANAMTLATSDGTGMVSARTVLLKGILSDGLLFFTNYESEKATQIASNPRAEAVFHWPHLYRQVRVQGDVMRTTDDVSESYFHSRPRGSQISALISEQSKEIADRSELEERHREIDADYRGQPIPFPKNWGGFVIVAKRIEFWQSRTDRLHDRFRYSIVEQDSGNEPKWTWSRIAP